MQFKLALALVPFLIGCQIQAGPQPPKPRDPGDQDPPPDFDLIADMCEHLRDMGCPEGNDVYNDDLPGPVDVPNQSCADFHKGLEKDGVPVNAECVLKAPTCEHVEDYRARDPRSC